MLMEKDCIFIKGSSHTICEDYATVGDNCIIVSDGCSSSKNTDVGARLLNLITKDVLESPYSQENNRSTIDYIVDRLSIYSNLDVFKDISFDATLLFSCVQDSIVYITGCGDGCIIVEYKHSPYKVISHLYNEYNAPCYLSYNLDLDRKKEYEEKYGKVLKCESFIINKESKIIENSYVNNIEYNSFIKDQLCFFKIKNIEDVKAIHLLSDGVESFSRICDDAKKESIPYLKVLEKLLDFKTYKGEFVKRRMNAFQKFCKKNNWSHYDDLSLASIYFDGE